MHHLKSLYVFVIFCLVSISSFGIHIPIRYCITTSPPANFVCVSSDTSTVFYWTKENPSNKLPIYSKCKKVTNGKEKSVKLNSKTSFTLIPFGYPNISNSIGPPVFTNKKYKFHMLVYGKLTIESVATGKIVEYTDTKERLGDYGTMKIISMGDEAYKIRFTNYDDTRNLDDQIGTMNFYFTDTEIDVELGLIPPDSITYDKSAGMYVQLDLLGENAVSVSSHSVDSLVTVKSDSILLDMQAPKSIVLLPSNSKTPIITVQVLSCETRIGTKLYPTGHYHLIYKVANYEYKDIPIQIVH